MTTEDKGDGGRNFDHGEPGGPLDTLFQKGIKPHAQELANMAMRGGEVGVIAFDPDPEMIPLRQTLGWQGRAVFSVTRTRMKDVAARMPTDLAWQRWAARPSNEECLRVFVIAQSGTLLMNYAPKSGWSVEPGSTDLEWMS